jgi:hypothetical protein
MPGFLFEKSLFLAPDLRIEFPATLRKERTIFEKAGENLPCPP